jgi:hypothetical protein
MSTFYVSATAANGIPAGNDQTGDGSIERPWATIDRANAAAANGDTVMLNDGVYSPTKTLEISNAVSWQSVTDYGATIRGVAGQSRVIGISEDQAGTVSFGKINIDGANTTTSLITLNNQVATYTIELNGTRLINPTSYGIQGTSAGTRANISMNDVDFNASSALSMVNISSMLAGEVSIQGGSVNIGSVWRSGFGGIATINANASGVTATVSGVTANLHATGTSAVTSGKGIYYGIRMTDVEAPLIERNTITQTGTSTDQTGYTMLVTYESDESVDISGGVIRYNTLKNFLDGSAGKIILVGADSAPAARNQANNFEIYGNSGTGDLGSEAAKLHGILVGWQSGAKVYDNSMDYTDLAYVMKGMSGETLVFDNTDTHTATKSLYQKGGTGVQFLYNTSYQADGFNPDIINIGDAGIGEYNAQDAVIVGNTLVYTSTPDSFLTLTAGSSASTISGNTYYAATGNASQAWIYKDQSYKTIDAWKAAVESNATSSPNVTLGQGAILSAIGLSGQNLQLVGMANGVQTYAVSFITGVASTTTFAIGNFGSTGAAAISGAYDANFTSGSLSGSGTVDGSYAGLDSGELLTFTVSYDGLSAVGGQVLHIYGNYTNTRPIDIVFNSIAPPKPAISGSSATAGSDVQILAPFASMVVTDADTSSATHTARVTMSNPGAGSFTELAGFVADGAGSYIFTGTVAEVNAALQALRFTPTANQVAVGGTVTTQFTVTYTNDSYTVSDTASQTIVSSVNDTPLLSGLPTNQTVGDKATIQPFAAAAYVDPDLGQTTTLRIALDKATRGTFTNLNGFVDNGDGSYTFTGTGAAADAALRGLVFTPAQGQAAPGQTTTAKLTITYSDGVTPTQTSVAYLAILAENTAPVLAGAAASDILDTKTVKPFATMTVTDPDKSAVETVTVRVDDPAKGAFTFLGGFTSNGDGSYSFTGSPGAVQTALRSMVFDPTDWRVPGGQTEVAQFTVTVFDGTATYTDTNTAVTITSTAPTNMAPVLSGLASSQTVSDRSTIQLFSGASYVDPDAGQTMTLTVALDKATRGSFTTLAGFVDNGDGTYTFTGSATATQDALQGLVFTPIQYQGMPGETITAKLTITYTDGVAPVETSVAYLGIQVENTAPALAGATASSIDDIQTLKPFATMTVADPDKAAVETVTVQLDDPAKGVFTTLGGFTDNGNGTYSFTGSPAAVQSALRAMVFDPTDGRVPGGQTETTRFTVTISDGTVTSSDNATIVTVTSTAPANTAPALSGVVASQTLSERATLQLFSAVSYVDPDPGQTATLTVSLDATALGGFTNLAGFVDSGNGTYTFTGAATAAQDALRGLVFSPTQHQVEPGQSAIAKVTVTYSDGQSAAQTSEANITIRAENTAPVLSGTSSSSVTDTSTVKPFAAVTVSDPDKSATETVTVRLDDPAKGSFTTLGGFTSLGGGVYTFSGTPAAAQSALRDMVFDPADGRLPGGQSDVARFTVTVTDGTTTATDSSTIVTITSSAAANTAPTLSGLVTTQTLSDRATIHPFANASYIDPDGSQTATVQVALDKLALGRFTTLAGFVDGGNGIYTFSGSAATAQAALRDLVFTPAQYQSVPGQSSTAKLTVTYTDGVAVIKTSTTSLTIQAENTAPVLSGTGSSAVVDTKTVKPFGLVALYDPDKGAIETVTVRLDDPAKGAFSSLGGFTDQGGGVYTYIGTAANARVALRSMFFDPADGRVAAGQSDVAQFTVSIFDGTTTVVDTSTTVTIVSSTPANTAPVLSGLVTSQAVTETATLRPFANATFADPDAGQTATVQVQLSSSSYGSFTTLAGFVDGGGFYTFSGTAAAAQEALRGLVFAPADHLAAPGSATALNMSVSYKDNVGGIKTGTTTVSIQAENTAPVLAGAVSSAVKDTATVKPFAMMTVGDPDVSASETVTVRLDDPSKGTFSTLGGFTSVGDGVYTYTGKPASAQTALRSMVFNPTDGRIALGQSEYAQFTVTVSDGMAAAFDDRTKVLVSGTAPQAQTLFASSLAA